MKEKFIVKYMMMAKEVGTRFNPCFSRHIGILIVDPVRNAPISTGYNGPPEGTPHCDTKEFLSGFFWPQLTQVEKEKACESVRGLHEICEVNEDFFMSRAVGKKVCPRRYVGAESGQRTTLCSCAHAERNAINRAPMPVHKMEMFCWCGVPCMDCTSAIIQSGIDKVHCLKTDGPDYFPQSRWMFAVSGVILREYSQEFLENYGNN